MSKNNVGQLLPFLFFMLFPLIIKALKKKTPEQEKKISGNDDYNYEENIYAQNDSLDDEKCFDVKKKISPPSEEFFLKNKHKTKTKKNIKKVFFKSKKNLKKAIIINEILNTKKY